MCREEPSGQRTDRSGNRDIGRVGDLPVAQVLLELSQIVTEAQMDFWSWHSEPAQVLAKALNIAVMWIAATMELASTGKAVEIGNSGLVVSDEWKNEDRVKKDLLELALKLHRG